MTLAAPAVAGGFGGGMWRYIDVKRPRRNAPFSGSHHVDDVNAPCAADAMSRRGLGDGKTTVAQVSWLPSLST